MQWRVGVLNDCVASVSVRGVPCDQPQAPGQNDSLIRNLGGDQRAHTRLAMTRLTKEN